MPRKVRPGPPVLRLESLSTGREIRPASAGADDFEQTVQIERVQDQRPVQMPPTVEEMRSAAAREKREFSAELLQRTGLVKPIEQTVRMVAPAIKGKRAGPKLGEHVMMIDNPPWRRV